MLEVRKGAKKDVVFLVSRRIGTGPFTLTTPERRILDASKAIVFGYNWSPATWDSSGNHLYCLFDSTLDGLGTPGIYYVQARGTIGQELWDGVETVRVLAFGP